MRIIPAILTNDKDELVEMLGQVEKGGYGSCQVDFVDEEFSNQTLPVAKVEVNKFKNIKFDAHLMLDPQVIWEEIALAKINGFKRIIAQVESIDDQERFVAETSEVERGLAVDLESSILEIDAGEFSKLDVVILMAVPAGVGGQVFDNKVIKKIKLLSELRESGGMKFKICIDVGVQKEQIVDLAGIGVDEVVVGVKRMVDWI